MPFSVDEDGKRINETRVKSQAKVPFKFQIPKLKPRAIIIVSVLAVIIMASFVGLVFATPPGVTTSYHPVASATVTGPGGTVTVTGVQVDYTTTFTVAGNPTTVTTWITCVATTTNSTGSPQC